ncbi:MAG: M23 family metallopeptidase [Spirochaetaceae bacterium]|nr:M23 family metallopeptidase [Spirochaetaceae bacterium]
MPVSLSDVKEMEKRLTGKMAAWCKRVFFGLLKGMKRVFSFLGHRVSFVVTSDPAKTAAGKGLRMPWFLAALIILAVAGLLGFGIYSSANYLAVAAALGRSQYELQEARGTIDDLREATENLTGKTLKFESALSGVLSIEDRKNNQDTEALRIAGLENLLNLPASRGVAGREVERLEGLADYMDSTAPRLERIASMLAGQKDIMSEVPNIWPIQGNAGHVSMYFGQNENPFSGGQWYLHNGIDISTFRSGDPILAAADGKIIDTSYDSSLGNCITIQHSHGFLTRYGHLRSIKVAKGQQVTQGQVIGALGNTGQTTGPHLHYEVHLGTSVIDPLRFLNLRKAIDPSSVK